MKPATISITENNQSFSQISVSGFLDESFSYPDMSQVEAEVIEFDIFGFEGINSIAISNWITWMKQFSPSSDLRFKNCKRNFINTKNIVGNFLPERGQIISVFVPYFCKDCDKTSDLFFEVDQLSFNKENKKPPEVPETSLCPNCNSETEIDVISGLFFSFLS